MKFSHAWLAEYVEIAETPERVGARLTAAGLPLDGIEGRGEAALYDFDIFANRPDCMSHVGLAREYAALTGGRLETPQTRFHATGPGHPPTPIAIEAADLCARYSARAVRGLRVGPSPPWLRDRLTSIGQRPINNVVDATNFVLWELGHPLHAFDLDRLEGRRIVVRRARAGESLVTLDGETRSLAPEMLVIADARRPVALAGIMGGRDSEIGEATRDILIESAWFEPSSVRRTARALGLRTDASHRFERGADPEGTLPALDRAASLIVEIAGGTVGDPAIDVHPRREAPRVLRLRPSRARSLLGAALEETVMREALERRGFVLREADGGWEVTVPSFRRDVEREVDLIEEVARHRGYDAIPAVLPLLPDASSGRGPADRRADAARRALRAAGLSEAVNFAMDEPQDGLAFDPGGPEPLAITNPLQAQASSLRTSLLPGLLRNAAHNLNHGLESCHLFEIGTVFRRPPRGWAGPTPVQERTCAAFVLAGRGRPVHWSLPRREVDLYDARGAAEVLAEGLGLSPPEFASDTIPFLEPGRALRIRSGGREIGVAGEVAGTLRERRGIERPIFAGEIDLDLPAETLAERRYRPIPRHPAVRRDLALIVERTVSYGAIERVVRAAATLPVTSVQPFDRYRGQGVPEGAVSLAIQVVFQHPERTLSAEEVQKTQDEIVAALGRELGARLRGPAADR
jgi:phenylalanyl-tRNA synthetase beta chain